MVSSNLKNKLYDPIRRKWVENTPEEIIRQALVKKMVEDWGYPISLLAIEKELSSLPHLQRNAFSRLPSRRLDILVFAKNGEDFILAPLLMIECKEAALLTAKFAEQVTGYNAFVRAPFVGIANAHQILIGHFDSEAGMYRFEEGMLPYAVLLSRLRKAR